MRTGSALFCGSRPGPLVSLVRRSPQAEPGAGGRLDLAAGSGGLRIGSAELGSGSVRGGGLLDVFYSDRDCERPTGGARVRSVRAAALSNPTTELAGCKDPDPAHAENVEPGPRGVAAQDGHIDASMFRAASPRAAPSRT